MRKTAIFEDVVSIMTQDSATKKDIVGADPTGFRECISDDMSEKDFLYQVQTYLASFGVIGHVAFREKYAKPKGFVLRSTIQGLYVEQANADTNLQAGDQIVKLDGQHIEEFYRMHRAYFTSSTPERNYREWSELISKARQVTVLRAGVEQILSVEPSQNPVESRFEWKELEKGVVYLRLDDFRNEKAINKLYQEAQDAIKRAACLVIDVRQNTGGMDSLYFPLLHYALSEGQVYSDLGRTDEGMEILYTERNVDLRLKDFEVYVQQEGINQETKDLLEIIMQDLQANRGKGYVKFGGEDREMFPNVKGGSHPEKIFVLADVYCASSGDNFVQMMKCFPKVTVLGRPTLGILDYSNCCQVDYGDYSLNFPTSRALALDKGQGMTDKGIEPDILIPWTVEHLKRDVDLERCLEMIHDF